MEGKQSQTHFSLGDASDMAFAVYGSLGAMVGDDVEKQLKRWWWGLALLRRIGAKAAVRAKASAGRSLRVASIGSLVLTEREVGCGRRGESESRRSRTIRQLGAATSSIGSRGGAIGRHLGSTSHPF